ncbi:hypothetical protein [Roseicella frigidaeris]|uniref:Uncharacterized protein n=1 Tax=Roseicella frigidaeris TaxID=2230885 RepID=A0A327M4I0_9PROT|nr:hypothetical protein [Roseicella frigidaeris]RAI57295.1 hypothetical protein DOO78_19935 [Roseicella frigidaeris]
MESDPKLLAAMIGLIGVILGVGLAAALKAWFDRDLEDRKAELARLVEQQRADRNLLHARFSELEKAQRSAHFETYAEFWSATGVLVLAQRAKDETAERQALARLAAAKGRIALHGSERVIALLAEFDRGGAILDTPERCARFIEAILAMRQDASEQAGEIRIADLHRLLLGG